MPRAVPVCVYPSPSLRAQGTAGFSSRHRLHLQTFWSGCWELRTACVHVECPCMLTHLSRVQLRVTLWTIACQASLSMGFPRQEYWRG